MHAKQPEPNKNTAEAWRRQQNTPIQESAEAAVPLVAPAAEPIAMDTASLAHLLYVVGSMCLGVGLCVLGVLCFFLPHTAAEMYGLPLQAECSAPARQDEAWVLATGFRDLFLGIITLALYLTQPQAMRVYTSCLVPLPLADALLALAYQAEPLAVATHLGGTFGVLVLAIAARCDPALDSAGKGRSA